MKTRRRLTDVRGILERRRFQALREEFYHGLWSDAAAELGADVARLKNGLLQISRGSSATFVRQSEVMLDSALAGRLLLDKEWTYERLAAKGLRTPRRACFDLGSFARAEEFLLAQPGPVVVKPSDGTGCGHGVTTHVADRSALRDAATHAAAFHSRLIVEEQLSGASYRLLFLDGEFLDAVRRDPPTLTGDGQSSIRQLAQQENELRRSGERITALSPLMIDRESRNTLAAAGLTPNHVPALGERVRVKLAVNENAARENHVVRDAVHPDIVETCSRVARDFRIGFAGFDLISEDISAPPEEGLTVFTEINAGPGIHHHCLVAEPGRAAPVARTILEHIFETRRGTIDL
ncbi:cyanophycin synthetase [Altererythrobacter soli]|uniref:Cyanophycin synthetase n=1 Tax=Croceibacterium soli TaxID=1739690 RepID=A0A6I4URV7_9SPHN|nr:cyanophycin synthetase [Croceibacterium soli]MXP41378.1 cyanophycin synthetase [Croceibacterium soli]